MRAFTSSKQAFPSRHVPRMRQARPCNRLKARGTLDTEQVIAVTQQISAYSVLVAIEGFWALARMPEQPGKAKLLPTVAGIGSLVAITAAVQQETLQFPAEVAGAVVSALLMAYYIKRSIDVRDPTQESWPGPKASPAGMALVAFFCLNIFVEGLRSSTGA